MEAVLSTVPDVTVETVFHVTIVTGKAAVTFRTLRKM